VDLEILCRQNAATSEPDWSPADAIAETPGLAVPRPLSGLMGREVAARCFPGMAQPIACVTTRERIVLKDSVTVDG
jgi:hypothetical protein